MPAKKINSKKTVSLNTSQFLSSPVSIPFSRCGGCTNTLKNCTCYDNISDEAVEQINEYESKYRKEMYFHNETKEELKGASEIIKSYGEEIQQLKSDIFTSKTTVEARDNTIETLCKEKNTLYDEIQELKERIRYLRTDNNEAYREYNEMNEQHRRNTKIHADCYAEIIKQKNEEARKERESFEETIGELESENKTYQSKLFNLEDAYQKLKNEKHKMDIVNKMANRMITKRQRGLLAVHLEEELEKEERTKKMLEGIDNGTFFFPKKKDIIV
jgi:chromosome segregation ATPase